MAKKRYDLTTDIGRAQFEAAVQKRLKDKKPCEVELLPLKRTIPQNDHFWAIYNDVRMQRGDMTETDVVRMMKLHCGVPILRADDADYRAKYDRSILHLPYEYKLEAMDIWPVTSLFNVDQGIRYIDAMIKFWAEQGIVIINPRERMLR